MTFYHSRFAVGHKCFVIQQGAAGMWRVLPEQVTIEKVIIATYYKSNYAKVTYLCSDRETREEGMLETGEEIQNVLFGSVVDAKAACGHRNNVSFF